MAKWKEPICGSAEAAEAKLAEVTAERDEANEWADGTLELLERVGADRKNLWARIETAEATVATLTAQMEAMRGERDMAVSALQHEFKRSRRHLALSTLETLASLTTENQTNG